MVDLSKFRKIRQNAKHFVLKHEDGHELHMDRSKLDPDLDGGLAQLKMADGGDVAEKPLAQRAGESIRNFASENPWSQEASIEQSDPVPEDQRPINQFVHGLVGEMAPPQAPEEAPAPEMAAPAPMQPQPEQAPTDPYGYNAMLQATQHGYEQQRAGITNAANAAGAQGNAEASVYGQEAAQQKTLADHYQEHYNALETERQGFRDDIQNQHIDPNHYMNSRTDGQKSNTAIGLLLSGLGSGITGQPNMASQYLDQQIGRDIDAQKAELGKKENLLSANMRQFGNLHDATAMTRVMYNDMYGAKLKQAAAKSQSPIAHAIAQQELGKLEMTNASLFQQIAMRQTMMKGMGENPGMAIQMLVPKEQHGKAMEELKKAQDLGTQRDALFNLFDKASTDNTAAKTGFGMLRTPAAVTNFQVAIMPYLKDAEGRVNESEIHRVDGLLPKPGDTQDKVNQKRQGLAAFLSEKSATPLLDTYGIKVKGVGKFNTSGQRTLKLGPVK